MSRAITELPSLEGLQYTLDAVRSAGGLVIGSIGRAAIFAQIANNPLLEFEVRGTQLLTKPDGKARDVDIIGPYGIDRHKDLQELPHLVDETPFGIIGRLLRQNPSGVWSYLGYNLVREEIDAQCFEPIEGDILGVTCRTVRPATHMALQYGPKSTGHLLLEQYLPEPEREFLNSGIYGPLWSAKTNF